MKMTPTNLKIAAILISGIFYFSCGNDITSDPTILNGTRKLIGLDISDATSLFIAPFSEFSLSIRAAVQSNKMFKITEEGYVQEITYSYIDGNGDQITSTETFNPTAIHNINENFILVDFSQEAYLIRKADGAVFRTYDTPILKPQEANFINAPAFQVDGGGNIYYQSGDYSSGTSMVVKIDITNPNNITRSNYLPDPDKANRFFITQEGHVVYENGQIRRVKKANGGLYNLSTTQEGFFIGLNGKIKNLAAQTITIVNIDSGFNVTTDTIRIDGTPFDGTYGSESFGLYSISANNSYLLTFTDKILLAGRGSAHIYEIDGTNPHQFTFSPPIEIDRVCQSDSYIYITGKNFSNQAVLYKFDPYTEMATSLFSPDTYDIFMMIVNDDDVLTFNALRMSDGKKVLGNISSDGSITILNESLNVEVTTLKRIK